MIFSSKKFVNGLDKKPKIYNIDILKKEISILLEIKTPTEIKLDSLKDLQEYKKSMNDNILKINIAALSREYKVDRRTINKYLNGLEKKKTKNKISN